MYRERCACPRSFGTRNHGGMTSSIRYEECSRQNFVRMVRSHAKGGLVLIHPVPGIMLKGLRPSGLKSHEMRACPHPSATRNQASETSTVRYEVASEMCPRPSVTSNQVGGTSSVNYNVVRKVSISFSIWFVQTSRQDFIPLVRCHVKGVLVLIRRVRGIK